MVTERTVMVSREEARGHDDDDEAVAASRFSEQARLADNFPGDLSGEEEGGEGAVRSPTARVDEAAVRLWIRKGGVVVFGCLCVTVAVRAYLATPPSSAAALRSSPAAREMLDCFWIKWDDCENQDWAACQCRTMNPTGPCTECPTSTCKSGCCGKCLVEAEKEARAAAAVAEAEAMATNATTEGETSLLGTSSTTTTTWPAMSQVAAPTPTVLAITVAPPLIQANMASTSGEAHLGGGGAVVVVPSATTTPPEGMMPQASPLPFNPSLGVPTLFCFTLAMPTGGEAELLRQQQALKAGLFACASYKVFSNVSFAMGPVLAEVVGDAAGEPLSLQCDFGTKWHLALNSYIFVTVWEWILAHRYHEQCDFTVKVDADTVFVPPLVQQQVKSHFNLSPEDPVFFNNCPRQQLHGPIEIVSRGGMRRLEGTAPGQGLRGCLAAGMAEREPTNREDWFLSSCLKTNGLQQVDDGNLLSERACPPFPNPVNCWDGKVAYHPFKDWTSWRTCLAAAEQALCKGPRRDEYAICVE